jgi:hypothetical protein
VQRFPSGLNSPLLAHFAAKRITPTLNLVTR